MGSTTIQATFGSAGEEDGTAAHLWPFRASELVAEHGGKCISMPRNPPFVLLHPIIATAATARTQSQQLASLVLLTTHPFTLVTSSHSAFNDNPHSAFNDNRRLCRTFPAEMLVSSSLLALALAVSAMAAGPIGLSQRDVACNTEVCSWVSFPSAHLHIFHCDTDKFGIGWQQGRLHQHQRHLQWLFRGRRVPRQRRHPGKSSKPLSPPFPSTFREFVFRFSWLECTLRM